MSETVIKESTLPKRVVDDLRRYFLQSDLPLSDARNAAVRPGEIRSGRAMLRGLDCAVEIYCSTDSSLLVLCAKPDRAWQFGECFPEIPNEASVRDFFWGNPPPEFKEPLLARAGLADSVWVLISAADKNLIEPNVPDILHSLGTWPKTGPGTNRLIPGLNLFGTLSLADFVQLRGDSLLQTVLGDDWSHVQANVQYRDGAPLLSVPIPLARHELAFGACKLTDLTVWISTPMYYVRRAPEVRLAATLALDKIGSFKFTADYPLDDDLIEAQLEIEVGKPPPFIGDIPHLGSLAAAEMDLTVGLSISKSSKAITKAYVDLSLRKKWEIVKGIIEVANPEFHFLVLDPIEPATRRVVARVVGELVIDGSPLSVAGNYATSQGFAEGQITVSLDPATPLNLTGLVQHLFGKESKPDVPGYNLDSLLFEYELNGHLLVQSSVSPPWEFKILDGCTFKLEQLRFLYEQWGTSKRFQLGADLELGNLCFRVSGDYSSDHGWTFQGATHPGQKLQMGALAQLLAAKFGIQLPHFLAGMSLQDVAFLFNTQTKHTEFQIRARFPLGQTPLDVSVRLVKQEPNLTITGKIMFGGAEFTLEFTSGADAKELRASWNSGMSGQLNLSAISPELPDLSDLGALLTPEEATVTLSLATASRSLAVDCKFLSGAEAAFLLKETTQPGKWIAALGFKPGKISTRHLGPLGSVLEPHNLSLDMVIVAANVDAPKDISLTLDKQNFSFSKGLLLQGNVEFEGLEVKYPFECRLGADEQPAPSPPGGPAPAPRTVPAPENSFAEKPAAPTADNTVTVGRTIGPVTIRKVRFESRNQRLYVMLDASLASGVFAFDLTGFNLSFPLSLLEDPCRHAGEIEVRLDGLSVSYSNPPLVISGGFIRTTAAPPYVDDLYEGDVLVKAQTFQITVFGSYGTIEVPVGGKVQRQPSLFLYGSYVGAIGGPPAFYVTGLALAGGYNSRLLIPPIENVAEFPLIQAVTHPKAFAENAPKEKLHTVLQPSYGDYWLAAGVKFESFKLADSFALFSVSFGTRLQFALLGVTKLSVPTGAEPGKSAVYAELALRAVLDPEAGVFSVEGRLTENSYVFARELHLTGGFAFFVWFGKAPQAGDFVISLGGYHRDFHRPSHYPVVPRVGIHGQFGPLAIAGEAYLALTPSCLMAGLKLEAVYQSGRIRAAFVAFADFIVAWAPFHYRADIGIGIAVRVRILRTFHLELGATLRVWGPPFGGTARVSCYIVSFTVSFGSRSDQRPAPLTWKEFRDAFLPCSGKSEAGLATVRITEGLVREVERDTATYRVVNPYELTIETDSAVPCTEIRLGDSVTQTYSEPIGVRPMDRRSLSSLQTVSIQKDARSVESKFTPVQWSRKNYPEALWSASPGSDQPGAEMIKNVLSGVVLRVQPETPKHRLGPFPGEIFKWQEIRKKIPWRDLPIPEPTRGEFPPAQNPFSSQIRECLVQREPANRKANWNEITLKNTFADPKQRFQAMPECASLGQRLQRLTSRYGS